MKKCTLEQASRNVEIIHNAIDSAEDIRAKIGVAFAKRRDHWLTSDSSPDAAWVSEHARLDADVNDLVAAAEQYMNVALRMIKLMAETTIIWWNE